MSPSNLEILAYATTPLGELCLRRRELLSRPGTVITEITLDHELLMSSYITVSERALAEEALARHTGRDLSVLVGGLGLGYTANAALQSTRVRRVEVVEFLPEVVGFLRHGLVPLSRELLADPRLVVRQGDVYEQLRDLAQERWDVVLIDVDHSPEEHLGTANESFYSESGLERAKQHLSPGHRRLRQRPDTRPRHRWYWRPDMSRPHTMRQDRRRYLDKSSPRFRRVPSN